MSEHSGGVAALDDLRASSSTATIVRAYPMRYGARASCPRVSTGDRCSIPSPLLSVISVIPGVAHAVLLSVDSISDLEAAMRPMRDVEYHSRRCVSLFGCVGKPRGADSARRHGIVVYVLASSVRDSSIRRFCTTSMCGAWTGAAAGCSDHNDGSYAAACAIPPRAIRIGFAAYAGPTPTQGTSYTRLLCGSPAGAE